MGLVSAERYRHVEEELARYRRAVKKSPFKLWGSVAVIGGINQAIKKIRKEREKSLERVASRLK